MIKVSVNSETPKFTPSMAISVNIFNSVATFLIAGNHRRVLIILFREWGRKSAHATLIECYCYARCFNTNNSFTLISYTKY